MSNLKRKSNEVEVPKENEQSARAINPNIFVLGSSRQRAALKELLDDSYIESLKKTKSVLKSIDELCEAVPQPDNYSFYMDDEKIHIQEKDSSSDIPKGEKFYYDPRIVNTLRNKRLKRVIETVGFIIDSSEK